MIKKFMLVACCACTVAVGMQEKEPKKLIGAQGERTIQPSAHTQEADALADMGIGHNVKFFIEFNGEKIAITRDGFMRCKHFMDTVEFSEAEDAEKNNELIFPWQHTVLHLATDHIITKQDLEFFVKIIQSPTFDFKAITNTNTLFIMLALADFANADLPQLRAELAQRITHSIQDSDYADFLRGTGSLWNIIHNIPPAQRAFGEFKFILNEGQPLTGHTGSLLSLIQLADGRLASGSRDDTIRIWNLNTMQPVGHPLTGHTNRILSLIQLADGRLASASMDRTIRIWDLNTMQPVGQPLTGHTNWVTSLIQLADGRFASASFDETIRIWDLNTMQPVGQPLTGHTGEVTSLIKLADGRLASGSWDGTIRIWDLNTMQPVGQSLTGHTGGVESLIQLADGRLASASVDKTIRIWDLNTMQPVGQLLTDHTGRVTFPIQLADGYLVSCSPDNTIRIWDLNTMQPVGQPLIGHTGKVTSIIQLADGRLASASYDGTIRIWDLNLNFEQKILTNALRRFKPQPQEPQELLSKTKKQKETPLTFASIFSNETLLDVFSSLPDATIRSLMHIHGAIMVRAAVDQLMKNLEQSVTANIHDKILRLAGFLEPKENAAYQTRARKLLDEIKLTRAIITKEKKETGEKKKTEQEYPEDID